MIRRRTGTRALTLIATATLCGCPAKSPQDAIEVVVQVGPGAVADCVSVSAWTPPAAPETTAPFPTDGGTVFDVAVYPGGNLGTQIQLQAQGFTGPACGALSAQSSVVPATFGTGIGSVQLLLLPFSCDGGCDGGADAGMDAGADGGTDAGFDGGMDSGTDAGTDAGQDSGFPGDGGCQGQDGGAPCDFGKGVCALDGTCLPGFGYTPSNFTQSQLPPPPGNTTVNCSASIDSTLPGRDPIITWCAGSPAPAFVQISQPGGQPALLLSSGSLDITSLGSLTLQGGRPIIFGVLGDATLDGPISAAGQSLDGGPAAGLDCGATGAGQDGQSASNSGGGGGGGFGTAGADGGVAGGGTNAAGGLGGAANGAANLIPLRAGCFGGAGDGGSPGGGGGPGGGFQLSASGGVQSANVITASGGGGSPGQTGNSGGGGGGSGGGLLLEGNGIVLQATAALTANGGAGGGGSGGTATGGQGGDGSWDSGVPATCGPSGTTHGGPGGSGGAGSTAPMIGTAGNSANGGGGGGGGAVGRIRLNANSSCNVAAGAVVSPASTTGGATACP